VKTIGDRTASFAAWLTPRRIRAQALLLAICLWGVCAIDYATPGLFDRAGNIKFQDFLQFPVVARLITQGRAAEIYNDQLLADGIHRIVGHDTSVHLQYFYGPQVALPFVPLIRLSFLTEATAWVAFSVLIYFASVYLLWKNCPGLRPHSGLVFLCAVAFPPLFHFFVRGQLSAIVLLCFTLAWIAFRSRHAFLAGVFLGMLAFKPQFLVAVPFVLLAGKAWKMFAGLVISAGAQLTLTFFCFGPAVMHSYIDTMLHSASRPATAELSLSPIQMHSLRTFWALLIPSPSAVWVLYILSSVTVVALAASVWKSSQSPALRFSALVLAAALVNPHIYIYDLLAFAPVFLLIADCVSIDPQSTSTPALRVLLYLAFILPLLGPLSRWTHLQLSVPIFVALLWTLCCHPERSASC
jgi:alpha-1,2-mannosyltransferase